MGITPFVLRQGPLPRFLHGIIEYVAGAAFIAAPFVLGFENDTATAVSIVVGVLVLIIAATTEGATGLVNQIPLPAHVVLDFLLAAFLIAAPFLFGFSDEGEPTAFFIAVGVLHILVTIATRFVKDEPGTASQAVTRTKTDGGREPAGEGAEAPTGSSQS